MAWRLNGSVIGGGGGVILAAAIMAAGINDENGVALWRLVCISINKWHGIWLYHLAISW